MTLDIALGELINGMGFTIENIRVEKLGVAPIVYTYLATSMRLSATTRCFDRLGF